MKAALCLLLLVCIVSGLDLINMSLVKIRLRYLSTTEVGKKYDIKERRAIPARTGVN